MDAALRKYLGSSARAARRHLGLTQAEVARRVKLAEGVYGRIERGGMLPSLPTVLRLCRVLKLDANGLLGFSAPTPPAWFATPRNPEERSTVRAVLRTARRLGPRQLAALGTMARAMLDPEAPPDTEEEAPHAESEP